MTRPDGPATREARSSDDTDDPDKSTDATPAEGHTTEGARHAGKACGRDGAAANRDTGTDTSPEDTTVAEATAAGGSPDVRPATSESTKTRTVQRRKRTANPRKRRSRFVH
jgi:hypothetical protein